MKLTVRCISFLLSLLFCSSLNAMHEGWNATQCSSKSWVHVKIVDGKIEVPECVVTQVDVLHKKLIAQQSGNTEKLLDLTKNFVIKNGDGAITAKLSITKNMLENLICAYYEQNNFEDFFGQLCKNDQDNLINCVCALGASKITRLIVETKFSPEILEKILGGRKLDARVDVVCSYLLTKQSAVEQKVLKGHHNYVSSVAWSPDGKYIVSGSIDNTLILWNAMTGEQVEVLKGHQDWVVCVAWSPDGKYVVSGSEDKTLILLNGKTREQVAVLKGHQACVTCVAWSSNSTYIVSGSDDKTLILWNATTGEQIEVLKGHQDWIRCVAWSPDGKYIVSGSEDKTLILWDATTAKQVAVLEGHQRYVNCVAWSPDGKCIVSGSTDNTLILWNAKTAKQVAVLKGYQSCVNCVAWSPNGKYIVSGSIDNTLILWDAKTGKQVAVLKGHQDFVSSAAWSPNGKYIVSGSYDNTLILRDVSFLQKLTELSSVQQELVYRTYKGHIKQLPIMLAQEDPDCIVYDSLPLDVQGYLKDYFEVKK